ncbi:hypothetical protein PGTUg99_015592 [Puccinia graminis f. sp. tritici]|uniref:Uncharacterized protein n=1 Tax=Puccinia graminis f. sp. tritici TaxID=56615 RepID=A0A5B0NK59_PUCGR|nr:hypothetical protein PGTUg99_015592 [Puccinia graminis f. sp. tritici]
MEEMAGKPALAEEVSMAGTQAHFTAYIIIEPSQSTVNRWLDKNMYPIGQTNSELNWK